MVRMNWPLKARWRWVRKYGINEGDKTISFKRFLKEYVE